MKRIAFFLISSFFTISLMAQLTWYWNSPKLGYDPPSDVFFIDVNNGWAISNTNSNNSNSGIILHTNNGGILWHNQYKTESSLNLALLDLCFINRDKGWVVGTGGVLFKTTNGGQNWVKSNLPVNADLIGVCFIDENSGWVVGDFEGIFYTTNGGNSWNFSDQGTYDCHSDIYFFNNQIGIAIGLNQDYNKSRILKSSDGGLTWSTKYLFDDYGLFSVFFFGDNNGWVVGKGGNIIHSTDGGESWYVQESNVNWNFWEVRFINENKGYVAGEEGILSTVDGGNTWTETTVSGYEITGLCFPNQEKGYAVGMHDGIGHWSVCFKTNNGGETWSNGNAPPASPKVLCTMNENTLLIGGGNYPSDELPCILKTTNNGTSWNYQEFFDWYSPIEDMCYASGVGYAVNSYGYIIKTNDLGNSWVLVSQVNWLNNFSKAAITFFDDHKGWIGGQSIIGDGRGVIYHTSQGGSSWVKQIDGEFNSINGIQFINDQKGWAVTARDYEGGNWIPGQILFTENGGSNWNAQNTTGDFDYTGLCFINDQVGWVCGDVILKTTNGGNSWSQQLDPPGLLSSISFVDVNFGYAVGESGVIYRTSNGGSNWILENKITNLDLRDVCYVNSTHAWIVGENGLILHATEQSSSHVELNSSYNVAKIYPNPGCGKFIVEPTYSHLGDILVSLTDLNGQMILECKIKSGQAKSISIDISDKPTGLYILKLISKSFQESSKVIKH